MNISVADGIAVAQSIISVAAILAAALPKPNETANVIINVARKILDVMALNVGHAKNK